MRRSILLGLALGAATIGSAAAAQTNTYFGSAVFQTKRNCPTNTATACNGIGSSQAIVERNSAGGSGQAINSSFTATGTGAGSTAQGSASFSNAVNFGLPEIKARVAANGAVRIGDNIYAYQTYTYAGRDDLDLLLAANFHIVNSSTDNGDGTRAGGALASAGFAIWDRDDFFSYASPDFAGSGGFGTAAGLVNQSYLFGANFGCAGYSANTGGPSPMAIGSTTRSLSGGGANLAISQGNCDEETLTLYRGDQIVIASYAQLIVNRDAFADATGTFTIGLSPSMSPQDMAAFRSGILLGAVDVPDLPAVPEPASWAMMIGGFGLVGGLIRRRRVPTLAPA